MAGRTSARFDDVRAGTSWVFDDPERTLVARHLDEVIPLLREVDRRAQAGAWAWGYVGYEAAPAFDPALRVAPDADVPLAVFGIGGAPTIGSSIDRDGAEVSRPERSIDGGPWLLDWDEAEHAAQVQQVRRAIAAGDVYQVNLTTTARGAAPTDLVAWYRRLAMAQRGAYHAMVDFAAVPGGRVLVSASPELFFEWSERGIEVRPMKGTARRGSTLAEDAALRDALRSSTKERAENIMIVDLMRNDMSKVATVGSVRAAALLDAEPYETVWQLTSTITARPAPQIGLAEVFTALFPCGSVTGAPKAAAMAVIADLEERPRGPYCGAIGMVAPPGAGFRARFSVAIRTAVVDVAAGTVDYGVGGGITWGSQAAAEYDEVLAKTAVLQASCADFRLLETLRFEPDRGCQHLDLHLERMGAAALFFGFAFDRSAAEARVTAQARGRSPQRVRLLLDRAGDLEVDVSPLDELTDPVTLAIDNVATEPSAWTRHKTTRRAHYETAAARHPRAEDVVLVTPHGDVMETTRANLAVRLGADWFTPPLATGCLPGVARRRLLDQGTLTERNLTVTDLRSATAIAVVSSLRGWRPARLQT